MIACQTQVHFSPHGGAAEFVAEELAAARDRIRVAIYGLNNPVLVTALLQARQRGVSVAIKADKKQSAGKTQRAALDRLQQGGVSVEVSEMSRLLHDKFAAVDARWVITGSFNWTVPAENRNRENVLVLDCPSLARLYEQEWTDIRRDEP